MADLNPVPPVVDVPRRNCESGVTLQDISESDPHSLHFFFCPNYLYLGNCDYCSSLESAYYTSRDNARNKLVVPQLHVNNGLQ